MNERRLNLGLTGGGTAGHVLPHFALISNQDSPLRPLAESGQLKVFYFGGKSGMEREIVTQKMPEWIYVPIRTGKLRRYFSFQNFIDPINIVIGFLSAIYWMKRLKIQCLFSKGGFVSAPVVWAAWLNRIPVVIHESDATPALATQLTIPFARRALVSFEETLNHIPMRYKSIVRVSGIPLRSELFSQNKKQAYHQFGLDESRPTLLVFGGSLGAEGLNRKFAPSIPLLSQNWNIIHIVGKGKSLSVPAYQNYRQFDFLSDEMALAFAIADVALCRAGASSIFELAAARIPMILVPLGLHQSRGDQIINARIFSNRGWSIWCDEEQLIVEKILSLVEHMRVKSSEYRAQLLNAPGAGTAAKVAALLISLMKDQEIAEPF